MVNLPKLKVSCGIVWQSFDMRSTAVSYPLLRCVPKLLCPTCQHNLDAVKKNAAAHQKEFEHFKDTPATDVASYHEGARDAVLTLAGLTTKDLEGDGE